MAQKLYLIFSVTPFKTGTFIRAMTHWQYNHVAVAFDKDLKEMYTFARYYRSVPLYGGFVRDSKERYIYKKKTAYVKICEVPVREDGYRLVKDYIDAINDYPAEYIYNIFSAITVPLKKRVLIRNAFTCAEFAIQILSMAGTEIERDRFYAIDELADFFDSYTVYEGIYRFENTLPQNDFEEKKGLWFNLRYTAGAIKALLIRIRHS
jgi:hypothetical protein